MSKASPTGEASEGWASSPGVGRGEAPGRPEAQAGVGWGGRTAGQGLKPRRRGLWEKGGQPRGAQGFVLGALWAVSASAGG